MLEINLPKYREFYFTHLRQRRQAGCYQYNDVDPVAQKKYIIKRLT